MEYEEIFSDTGTLLDALKKADRTTRRNHPDCVTLERAIFLSWWCAVKDCQFCFMSTQRSSAMDRRKARRKLSRILAEAEICRRIGWDIEFLSSGYGAYETAEIKEIAEMVAHVTGSPVWLNVGVLKKDELEKFGNEVEGVVGSAEAINRKLHEQICPSKPLDSIERMLEDARDSGMKTGLTIVLGLGEKPEDVRELFELMQDLESDRITLYSLNPHTGTPYGSRPPPSSLYQAGIIALTRINFPKIKITAGTWIDQLPNIGLAVVAGANSITKYPLFRMFGNRYGRKVEEEIRYTNKKLVGTFSDLGALKGIKKQGCENKPEQAEYRAGRETAEKVAALKKETRQMVESYIKTIEKQLTAR